MSWFFGSKDSKAKIPAYIPSELIDPAKKPRKCPLNENSRLDVDMNELFDTKEECNRIINTPLPVARSPTSDVFSSASRQQEFNINDIARNQVLSGQIPGSANYAKGINLADPYRIRSGQGAGKRRGTKSIKSVKKSHRRKTTKRRKTQKKRNIIYKK